MRFILLLLLFVFGCARAPIDMIKYAQQTGDYSYCAKADNYKLRCIAETEFEHNLIVEYDCCTSCEQPECFKYIDCGRGGLQEGCPMQEFCAVNESWLCEQTGGVVTTNVLTHYFNPRFCNCSEGVYISNYGCADCDSFEHEETKEYCFNVEENPDLAYFRKYCPE